MHFERRGNERQSVGTTFRYQKKNQGDKTPDITQKLQSYTKKQRTFQVSAGDSIVTLRGDRYVIPVKQEYKGFVNGIVHDQSATGANSFCGTNGNSATEQRPARSHSRRKSGNTKNFAGIYRQNISCFAKDRCFGRNYQRHRRNFSARQSTLWKINVPCLFSTTAVL